jgi:hypothetical protein
MPSQRSNRALPLPQLLQAAGERMAKDLQERLLTHPGELGSDREEVVRGFLRSYLPRRFEISTGFVFDCNGRISGQLDVIIVDAFSCPRFETAGGIRIYPCESVVAVGQIRSSVTSVTELHAALDNLESAKSLDRSGGGKAVAQVWSEQMDPTSNHLHQMFTFMLITGRALAADTMREKFLEYILQRDAHLWPNIVFAVEKYLLTFCCDAGICPNPMDARAVAIQPASRRQDLVLRFYMLLAQAVEVTRVSAMSYWSYLESVGNWDYDLAFATWEDAPPFLRSLPRL